MKVRAMLSSASTEDPEAMTRLNRIGKEAFVKHHKEDLGHTQEAKKELLELVGFEIRRDVTFAQLAGLIWFAETGTGYTGQADSPLPGAHDGRAIYLLYNGILGNRSVAGGNVLTGPVFDVLPKFAGPKAGPKVIDTAASRMGSRAAREGITFKQTPYALEV